MELLKKYLPVVIAAAVGVIVGALVLGGRGGSGSETAGPAPSGGFSFKGGATASPTGADCKTTEEKATITGESLAGIFKSGDQVKMIKNYYACKDANREDIVVYSYAGQADPLVKIVKAIPSDKWELKKNGSGWNILVNGFPAKTSNGTPYLIGDSSYRMLSLYAKDYGGIIPPNTYLILGNSPEGTLDSTKFGLVDKSGFIGKVVK